MTINRKEFIKKACFSSICACGFSSVLFAANKNDSGTANEPQDTNKQLIQDWLLNLISNLGKDLDAETLRTVIKKSSITHYDQLNMDEMLSGYIGDLDKFLGFIENQWGWKIDYDKTTKTLIADENKDYCVCPVLQHHKDINSSAMCYCSEGFAEKMFSVVSGSSTTATVISSVRRGDKSCKYKIVFN